jgi:acyl-CoA synthetase (AMP-forming)/AMP-acid ligase II
MSIYKHTTIHQLLVTQAATCGDNLAITDGEEFSQTYAGLLNTVDRLILELYSAGINPRDRVSIVGPNGVDLAITLLGVSSFATAVPLNPAYTAKEFESYFREMRVKWLVVFDGYETPALNVARSFELGAIRVSTKSLNVVSHKQRDGQITSVGNIAASSDDICLILLTSGSTGRPKKVPLRHRNVLASTAHICESLLLSSADKCLCMWEQFHVGGLVDLLLVPLASGGSTLCAGGFNAQRLLELADKHDITWFQAVPTTLHELSVQLRRLDHRIGSTRLRFVRSVAAALSPVLMEEIESLFGVPVLQTLGMTEAGPLITTNRLPPGRRKAGSVGLPAGPDVKIVGPDGNTLPFGVAGKIMIRGENVFDGYEDAPEANKESFQDGWFYTGDNGYFDPDDFLFLTGRTKEMINRGGEKISPQEIDDVLQLHPKIAQAAAFSIKHQTLGEDVGVAVVLKPGQQLSAAELRTHVAQHLVSFKVPQRINFLDKMPRDHVGRINRAVLAAQVETNTTLANRENIERRIARIWASELNLPFVGPDENFFEIGGDSLAGLRVLLAIEADFNHRLSPHIWSSISTVTEMANVLRRDLAEHISKTGLAAKSPSMPDELFRTIGMVMSSGAIKTMPDDPTIKIINPDGEKVPLVWVFNSPDREMTGLSQYWNSNRPLLGLYSGSRQIPNTEDTRKKIAAYYCDRVIALFPDGEFYLAGNCRGGRVAHKMLEDLNERGVFPKRVMFLEYIDQSLFNYPGEVRFVFGKQSHLRFSFSAGITAVLRNEKETNSKKLFWVDGAHGEFFHRQNCAGLAREIHAFVGEH